MKNRGLMVMAVEAGHSEQGEDHDEASRECQDLLKLFIKSNLMLLKIKRWLFYDDNMFILYASCKKESTVLLLLQVQIH